MVVKLLSIVCCIFHMLNVATCAKEYKIICYFTNWAVYRPYDGSFGPNDIAPNLCTHIIYSFVLLNSTTMESMHSNDPYADFDMKFYQRITSLRSSGRYIILSIGGELDSFGDKYSRLVRSQTHRKNFAKQATDFIIKYGFDGIDFDWEFPVCWNSNCTKGPPSDKRNFVKLLVALRKEFNGRKNGNKLLLSVAVAADKEVIDKAYDVVNIFAICDWVSIMGYDFHGTWESETGLIAPFTQQQNDDDDSINVKAIVEYYLQKGANPSKLILGIPTYGAAFTLYHPEKHDVHSHTTGPGKLGFYTNERGALAFYEIVRKVKYENWNVIHLPNIGSYAYKDTQWVGYDDIIDVAVKSKYIIEKRLGGAMVWTLDMDNFMDASCKQKNPILSAVHDVLYGASVYIENCT